MLKTVVIILTMMFMNIKQVYPTLCMLIFLFNLQVQHSETGKISYILMGDLLSFWVTNLSLWIIMLVIMIKTNSPSMSSKLSTTLTTILAMTFYTWNFMAFFIMFEMSMMIIVIVVMSWGYQPERVEAILFMIIMTSLFSLPFFFTLMNKFNQLNFWFMKMSLYLWDYLSFMLIFMIKMPTYFIHIWLPKVHVEAPVQGSMVLASIMLKLGCYGMIRMLPMMFKLNYMYEAKIVAFSLWTATLLSMVANIQADLKSLIAYSSVVHMTTTLATITLSKPKSMLATMIIMLGHGLCSSALFFTCNQMYKHSKSRSSILNKGILASSPVMTTMWFMMCMSNAPMPPSINIIGELLAFKTMLNWSKMLMLPILTLMFASSCYSILLFCLPAHGKFSVNHQKPVSLTSKTLTIMWAHTILLAILAIKSNIMEI